MSRHIPLGSHLGLVSARPSRSVAVFMICLGSNAVALATEFDVSVTIFADHYVWAGIRIDHVDAIERLMDGLRPEVIRLEACGSNAERAQRAAAHRLQRMNIELRWLPSDSQRCRARPEVFALPSAVRDGHGPYGIDDDLVNRWWHLQMP